MKFGIGAKAGLASGIILGSLYILGVIPIYVFFYLAKFGSVETEPGKISVIGLIIVGAIGSLFVFLRCFIGGYYELFIQSKIYFVVLIIGTYTVLGAFFQGLFNFLPTKSSAKKGIIYAISVWFIIVVLTLFLSIVSMEFNIELKKLWFSSR